MTTRKPLKRKIVKVQREVKEEEESEPKKKNLDGRSSSNIKSIVGRRNSSLVGPIQINGELGSKRSDTSCDTRSSSRKRARSSDHGSKGHAMSTLVSHSEVHEKEKEEEDDVLKSKKVPQVNSMLPAQ